MTNEQNATQSDVAVFKERVYTRALELTQGTYHRGEVEGYLAELGLVPTLTFPVRDGETVESVNAAVYAKLEELDLTQHADRLGLEQPGTEEFTVAVTFRMSPVERELLMRDGKDEIRVYGKHPVRVTVESDTEPTKA